MYVIYPADELLRIYENRDRDPSPVLTGDRGLSCQVTVITRDDRNEPGQGERAKKTKKQKKQKKEGRRERGQAWRRRGSRTEAQRSHEVAKPTRQHARTMQNSRVGVGEDVANPLKELTQPGHNEALKQHNAAALKLVQTGEWLLLDSFLQPFFSGEIPTSVNVSMGIFANPAVI